MLNLTFKQNKEGFLQADTVRKYDGTDYTMAELFDLIFVLMDFARRQCEKPSDEEFMQEIERKGSYISCKDRVHIIKTVDGFKLGE